MVDRRRRLSNGGLGLLVLSVIAAVLAILLEVGASSATALPRIQPSASRSAVADAAPAVDTRSLAASARTGATTSGAVSTYDYRPAIVRGAQPIVRAQRVARLDGGPLLSLARGGVAAKAGTAGADDVLNGVRLRAQLTGQEIAGGHAFEKHILDLGEFPGIRTRAQFASHIEDVVLNGEMRTLGGGRTAFWRDGTVVIRNPRAPDGGTAFQPTDGYDYFLNQLH